MKKSLLAGAAAAAILIAGCSSAPARKTSAGQLPPSTTTTSTTPKPKETAQDALLRQFDEALKGQYGPSWDELLPSQQAFVNRDRYISCNQSNPVATLGAHINKVVATYQETVGIPGTDQHLPSTAITVELAVTVLGHKQTQDVTSHEFLVDGLWRWSLQPSDADTFKAGNCPSS